jgi:uncharacterized membrane protein YccC
MNGLEVFEKRYIDRLTIPNDPIGATRRQVLEHSARTAVTAVASMLAARVLKLPQTYWAPITTMVITQSSLGATVAVSWQRFIGTAVGATLGALVASHFETYTLVVAASVFLLGLFCGLRMDRSASRFGGVTLAIVLLVQRGEPAWQIAFHRFAEVSTGIAVALVMTVVWPERDATTSTQQGKDIPVEPTATFGERSRTVHRDPSSYSPMKSHLSLRIQS